MRHGLHCWHCIGCVHTLKELMDHLALTKLPLVFTVELLYQLCSHSGTTYAESSCPNCSGKEAATDIYLCWVDTTSNVIGTLHRETSPYPDLSSPIWEIFWAEAKEEGEGTKTSNCIQGTPKTKLKAYVLLLTALQRTWSREWEKDMSR